MCVSFLLLFLFVPLKGVHAVLKTGNWVRYCIFDLATGKAEQENNFPTSSIAFLGQNERNVAIFTAGQVRAAFSSLRIDKRLASLCLVGLACYGIKDFRIFSIFSYESFKFDYYC